MKRPRNRRGWMPRLLGIVVCLFLSSFALDTFREGRGFFASLPAFFVHLAPALLLLAAVAASWWWEWVGGAAFVALATVYATLAWRHPAWVLIVSGPLFLVGVMFIWSWRHHDELHPSK